MVKQLIEFFKNINDIMLPHVKHISTVNIRNLIM